MDLKMEEIVYLFIYDAANNLFAIFQMLQDSSLRCTFCVLRLFDFSVICL